MSAVAGARIGIVTPAPAHSRSGNRVTALRWARALRRLGFDVWIRESWQGEDCGLLIVQHLQKGRASAAAFAERHPERPLVLALTGTDIYPEFSPDDATLRLLRRAHRILALQPEARTALPTDLRDRVRIVVQSATATCAERPTGVFRAAVLAHLRPVKDPLLPARAAALLPAGSRVRVELAGRAMSPELAAAARAAEGPRFAWRGELRRQAALELLAGSHVCIVPSLAEGGANVVSEAIAAGTPVLASAIPGNLGLLGTDWPGTFPSGDAAALARLLQRAADDAPFHAGLRRRTLALRPLVDPERERRALAALLAECGLEPPQPPPPQQP